MLLIAKKTFRHSISWDNINSVGAVFGKIITLDGVKYIVRLLSTTEWNKFMYPLHISHPDGSPVWANYSDCDLLVKTSCGNGGYSWTSSLERRGGDSITETASPASSSNGSFLGWRPVLEFFA